LIKLTENKEVFAIGISSNSKIIYTIEESKNNSKCRSGCLPS
jgi:hypothetical protein